jgi:hypothetical protein
MYYKKIFTILNFVNFGGVLLVCINFFYNSGDLSLFLYLGGILYFILLTSIPAIAEIERQLLVRKFGSRDDNDILAHIAEIYYRKVLPGKILVQLDSHDEAELTGFAENIKGMYGSEVIPSIKKFYPELADERIDSFLTDCMRAGKEMMYYVFFPDLRGEADQPTTEAKIANLYPFLSTALIRRIFYWWKEFKVKLEWQTKIEGRSDREEF